MKKIKLFPTPHVEVRLHISDQMIKDYKECQKMAEEDLDGKDCNKCSWRDIAWLNHGFCELKELRNLIGEEGKRMNCENCGNENVRIINTARNTYVCEKCGRDTESLFEIKLYKEIRNKTIEDFSCKLMSYFADCQLIEESAIVRDVLEKVIEKIDEITEQIKEVRK